MLRPTRSSSPPWHRFKGLDADAVFLLDVDDLESQEALASVYVGTSRARLLLVVFVNDKARGAFENQARRFGAIAALEG